MKKVLALVLAVGVLAPISFSDLSYQEHQNFVKRIQHDQMNMK